MIAGRMGGRELRAREEVRRVEKFAWKSVAMHAVAEKRGALLVVGEGGES
jgi:hypothetical protein